MRLSDLAIRNAKPKQKAYRVSDGGGLHLLIQPSGSKLWQLRYKRFGKENVLSFGGYPIVSLHDARRKRDEAKKLLVEGTDPAEQRRKEKRDAELAARQTFGLIADEYLGRMKTNGAAQATLDKTEWLLKKLAAPIANRPIREIHPAELLKLLQQIEKSGRRETARRLRGVIGSVYKYAIVTLRADENPTLPLHGALLRPKIVGRAAIIDEQEFGKLLMALEDYDGWPTIKAGMKMLILTCVRPGEVRGAVRSEFDLDQAVWRIPAKRMKMRQPHDVPLSRQALQVLKEIWSFSEKEEDFVFPSIRSKRRPLSENAFNTALRRLGYGNNEATAHGFRVTASSILNSRGYDPDVIEAVLAHQDRNAVRRAYNRATYWKQRVILMQEWADLLEELRYS